MAAKMRAKIAKTAAPALDVEKGDETVNRLEDMDTREVSLVDRAANKKTFLIVKRDTGPADTDVEKVWTEEARAAAAAARAKASAAGGVTHEQANATTHAISNLSDEKHEAFRGHIATGDHEGAARVLDPKGSNPDHAAVTHAISNLSDEKHAAFMDRLASGDHKGAAGMLAKKPGQTKTPRYQAESDELDRLHQGKSLGKATDTGRPGSPGLLLDGDNPNNQDPMVSEGFAMRNGKKITKRSLPPAEHAQTLAAIDKTIADLTSVSNALKSEDAEVAHIADQFEVGSTLKGAADEMNQAFAGIFKSGMEDPVATETKKVGAPMQGDRLAKLKGAVTLMKEAVREMREGSKSTDKFEKAAGIMAGIIHELDVTKAVNARDQRGLTPFAPNLGSGVQPDVSTVADASFVFGEGVPPQIGEILKNMQTQLAGVTKKLEETGKNNAQLAGQLKKRDATIGALETELSTIKKTRVAPSTGPTDDEGSVPSAGELVLWPADMSSGS